MVRKTYGCGCLPFLVVQVACPSSHHSSITELCGQLNFIISIIRWFYLTIWKSSSYPCIDKIFYALILLMDGCGFFYLSIGTCFNSLFRNSSIWMEMRLYTYLSLSIFIITIIYDKI